MYGITSGWKYEAYEGTSQHKRQYLKAGEDLSTLRYPYFQGETSGVRVPVRACRTGGPRRS